MEWLTSPETWIALLTLTVLEIVLGIDNIIFVSIPLLDIVFSLDSVITAVGMVRQVGVMIAAIVLAVLVMLVAAGPISNFVHRHPTLKMLALSFLLLIGVTLIADGLGQHIPKGYVYFAMGFSVVVESLKKKMLRDAFFLSVVSPDIEPNHLLPVGPVVRPSVPDPQRVPDSLAPENS